MYVSRSQFGKIAVLSFVFCGSVVSGNVSLRFLPVSFTQAVGATTPFFTAVFAYVMTVKREAWLTYLTLLPVVKGVVIASGILLLKICDAVAVAKILNATLVIPHLEVNPVWQDTRSCKMKSANWYLENVLPMLNRLHHSQGRSNLLASMTSLLRKLTGLGCNRVWSLDLVRVSTGGNLFGQFLIKEALDIIEAAGGSFHLVKSQVGQGTDLTSYSELGNVLFARVVTRLISMYQ